MRLKWLSLVHQQGYEKNVKSPHFHENSNFHKCSYTQCICSWGIWESTGVPTETGHSCCSLGFSLQILMFKQTSLGGKNQIF